MISCCVISFSLFLPSFLLINRKIRHLFFVCCCFSNCCFCISVFVIVHRLLAAAAAAVKCFLSKSTSFVQKFIGGRPGGSILNLHCPRALIYSIVRNNRRPYVYYFLIFVSKPYVHALRLFMNYCLWTELYSELISNGGLALAILVL